MIVPIVEAYTEKEYRFTETYTESRRVKEPDLFMILISPLTMFMVCLDGGCFGKYPDWSTDYPGRSGKSPSGNVRTKYRSNELSIETKVEWTGYNAGHKAIGSRQARIRGRDNVAIPVRQMAEALPERPANIDVRVSLPGSDDVAITVGGDVLGRMQLYSEEWLSVTERTALYTKQLREKLLARDWAGANVLFDKLEKLGGQSSPSFIYHYGVSLMKAGNSAAGRQYLENYLKQTKDDEHRAQAKQLLNG